jgi:hypothetical protein
MKNLKTFKIKRFDLRGTCYGETIFRCHSVRLCLMYLQDIFAKNEYTKIEREGYTFTKYTKTNIYHYAIMEGE